MLIFAISFFLSLCFVHLFTFLSLFLHSREQWLKCAYIYYSFVVFILKTVSKSCLLTTNTSYIQEVDDKNDTNVNCCKWWSLTIEDCLYKSHFELEVLSKFCTFYWMRRQLCIEGKVDDWHIWNPKYCTHLDIFVGIWTTVYRYALISPKPTIFLAPFYNAGVAEFLSTVPWSDQIRTSADYKVHLQM